MWISQASPEFRHIGRKSTKIRMKAKFGAFSRRNNGVDFSGSQLKDRIAELRPPPACFGGQHSDNEARQFIRANEHNLERAGVAHLENTSGLKTAIPAGTQGS